MNKDCYDGRHLVLFHLASNPEQSSSKTDCMYLYHLRHHGFQSFNWISLPFFPLYTSSCISSVPLSDFPLLFPTGRPAITRIFPSSQLWEKELTFPNHCFWEVKQSSKSPELWADWATLEPIPVAIKTPWCWLVYTQVMAANHLWDWGWVSTQRTWLGHAGKGLDWNLRRQSQQSVRYHLSRFIKSELLRNFYSISEISSVKRNLLPLNLLSQSFKDDFIFSWMGNFKLVFFIALFSLQNVLKTPPKEMLLQFDMLLRMI